MDTRRLCSCLEICAFRDSSFQLLVLHLNDSLQALHLLSAPTWSFDSCSGCENQEKCKTTEKLEMNTKQKVIVFITIQWAKLNRSTCFGWCRFIEKPNSCRLLKRESVIYWFIPGYWCDGAVFPPVLMSGVILARTQFDMFIHQLLPIPCFQAGAVFQAGGKMFVEWSLKRDGI